MDQRQLADFLGFQRVSSISDIEHGRARMQVHTLLRCAEIFDCSVQSLLSGNIREVAVKSEEVKEMAWRGWEATKIFAFLWVSLRRMAGGAKTISLFCGQNFHTQTAFLLEM